MLRRLAARLRRPAAAHVHIHVVGFQLDEAQTGALVDRALADLTRRRAGAA